MPLIILPSKNNLGKGSAPYCIRCQRTGSVDQAALVELIAQSFPILAKSLIEACLAKFYELLGLQIAEGRCVKTGIGSFYLCASGQLEDREQAFEPRSEGRGHRLRVHFRPNRSFERSVAARARIERLSRAPLLLPELLSAWSLQDDRVSIAKAGEFIKVAGHRLKFEKSDSLTGLFFLGGAEERSAVYAEVHPSSITAQVPRALAPGGYALAVRTKTSSGELREGRLKEPFLVE